MEILIYLLALLWLGHYALAHPILSDRLVEYRWFKMLSEGQKGWSATAGIMGSCFLVVLLPFLVHKLTRIKPDTAFKVAPCFFYALTPLFVFLISKQFFSAELSLIPVLVFGSNFFFLAYPNIGRVGVALGLSSGLFWALLTGNLPLGIVFAVLLPISHYGITYHTFFIGLISLVVLSLMGAFTWTMLLIVLFLLISILVWHRLVARDTGRYSRNFFFNVLSQFTFDRDRTLSPLGLIDTTFNTIRLIDLANEKREARKLSKLRSFFTLSHHDTLIQTALGRAYKYYNLPQKLEFILSWVLVLITITGFILSFQIFSPVYLVLSSVAFVIMMAVVAIPYAAVHYGVFRTGVVLFLLLSPSFVVGMRWLTEQTGIDTFSLSIIIIGLFALCVSGALHRLILGVPKFATQIRREQIMRVDGEDRRW